MLDLLTMLAGVMAFPWLCLAFLIWMAWLEDSLPAAVRRSARTPDPAPIIAIAVAAADPSGGGAAAGGQATVEVRMPGPRQASEVALSTEPSLGGSTNR